MAIQNGCCPDYPDEWICEKLDKLLAQFKNSPKLKCFIQAYLEQLEEIRCVIFRDCEVRAFDCAQAAGDELDRIGELAGFPRCHCNVLCEPGMMITCAGGAVIDYTSPVFIDGQGDPVTLTFAGVPAWLTMVDNTNGTFDTNGISPSGAGTYIVTITASDGTDECVTSLTIDCVPGSNTPPTCPANVTLDCAADFPYTSAAFIDPDGNPITLTAAPPSGYAFTDNGNGTYALAITGTATAGSFAVTADDGNGGTCTQGVTVTCAIGLLSPAGCPFSETAHASQAGNQIFTYGTFAGGAAPISLSTNPASSLPAGWFADLGGGQWSITVPPNTSNQVHLYDGIGVDANGNVATCADNNIEILGL